MSLLRMTAKPKMELTLKEDFEFNGKLFKKGHKFHPVNYDSIRGYDIEDSEGNCIGEVRMILDKFDVKDVSGRETVAKIGNIA
jgi:hypothetical protein